MSEPFAPVDLVLLWHHHQPDYRRPGDRVSVLPWVRLHATKDYLDMALRLDRHPTIRVTFNLVPSLLDQIESGLAGVPDALFELLARAPESLTAGERRAVLERCVQAPRHALERWPEYRTLCERAAVEGRSADGARAPASAPALTDHEVLVLEVWFLLAWLDPMFHVEPEAARALARRGTHAREDRDGLLALHHRLLARVVPAYRALAERGQVELSASPYYHPILPLLIDSHAALRARPQLAVPRERFTAPDDARAQIARARARHAQAFGTAPRGMWPSEGSVSPEAVSLAASAGVAWLASDEGVLWASLGAGTQARAQLYRPWRFDQDGRSMLLLFRDRTLSDAIGFVYQSWEPVTAARDFVERVRAIARAHAGAAPPIVSVMLDGENCWDGYADDGGPFLEALYTALAAAPDIRMRTPSEILDHGPARAPLARLHSGSWIDADFHVWIGHREKNRAWSVLAGARGALVAGGTTPDSHPAAWESLYCAEGSDWFWWLGDDHYTSDKALFDALFRAHVRAAYTGAGLKPPASLERPAAEAMASDPRHTPPSGFIHPSIDGRRTSYYEWQGAGVWNLEGAGGAMHRGGGLARSLRYGFDGSHFYLRLDWSEPPGPDVDLAIECAAAEARVIVIRGLARGERRVTAQAEAAGRAEPDVAGARCRIDEVLELSLPLVALGVAPGDELEMTFTFLHSSRMLERVPSEAALLVRAPRPGDDAAVWGA